MIYPVITSLIYSKKRRALMEVFPPRLRKLWKEWDLRVLVLLSLTLQVVLIILGNRRKYIHRHWIRIVVWSAYLAADYVATCGLGVLSNNLADMYDNEDAGSLDPNVQLTALWAPILLLHLGGPDTITAYALEDNELWLRHILGLIAQTVIAVYVFLMAWTGSHISILFIPMFLAGIVKYGERILVLWSVSVNGTVSNNDKIRDSEDDAFSVSNANFVHEWNNIMIGQGYFLARERVIQIRHQVDPSVLDDNSLISDEDIVLTAYRFLDLTGYFLLDAVLSYRDNTETVFRNMTSKNAFKVIEMELGLTYDLLYSKARLLYTRRGLVFRLITFLLICSVLVLFTFLDLKHKYPRLDLSITFLLLIVAIILEIYAAVVQLSSERFFVWLIMHNKTTSNLRALLNSRFIQSFGKIPPWSNKMSQFSFLNFSIKIKNLPCPSILKLLTIFDENVDKRWYVAYKEVPEKLKDSIFCHLRRKVGAYRESTDVWLEIWNVNPIGEYPKFDQELAKSILFWHILTEVLYYSDKDDIKEQSDEDLVQHWKLSKKISRYMMYVLVMHPPILAARMNQINFKSTFDQAVEALGGVTIKSEACKKLMGWHKQIAESNTSSTFSVLYNAVGCAKLVTKRFEEKDDLDLTDKWKKIFENWMEIMTYAASKCKGKEHAQQLRNGGELLTHVWLLIAHFGLTDHFTSESQITRQYGI